MSVALKTPEGGWRAGLMFARQHVAIVLRLAALVLSALCGWHGYVIVDHDRFQLVRALRWDALGLVLLALFAWNGALPHLARWPRAVLDYVRAHPVELALLAGIACIGVFVRLFRYGDLPPTGYLYLEEHINGGVAWNVLHGDRPLAYPLVRYPTAAGLWWFGPSTLGLRAPLIAAGIVAIVPFYLLMREVVKRPAALFATALFASLRVFADTSAYFQVPTLAVIVMVWMMLRGLRTGNFVWLVPAAALAAVMSYEYEAFKAVPLLAIPYLALVVVRALLWPLPESLRAGLERARRLAPQAAIAAIVITTAFLIGTGPLMAARNHGQHIYFASLDRQEGDREVRGTPGLFSPDALKQVKWSAEVYTPWVKPHFPVLGPVPTRGVVDRITSLMIWASVAAALLMFWRGSRLLFVSWFLGGLIVASVLLSSYSAWKIAGFAPPAVVLIGFLADDVFFAIGRYGKTAFRIACGGMAVIVVLVLALNLRVMNANAGDQHLLKEWSNTQSQLYSICDHLRNRPADNYAFVAQRTQNGWGFSNGPKDDASMIGAWGDFKFVCWGLQGQSIPSLQEAWPSYASGPVSVLSMAAPDDMSADLAVLRRAMPELGEPGFMRTAPADVFQVASFDVTGEVLNTRRGLNVAVAAGGAGDSRASILAGPSFALPTVTRGDRVTLSGVVLLPSAIDGVLRPVGGTPGNVSITVDGEPSYVGEAAGAQETPRQLVPGWHLVEVSLPGPVSAGETIAFQWYGPAATLMLARDDFFALADPGVWRHMRTLSGASSGDLLRYDYAPHASAFDGQRLDASRRYPVGTTVSSDLWSARWTVPASGTYRISIVAPGSKATLAVDGAIRSSTGSDSVFEVPLSAGDHQVELRFTPDGRPYIGGTLRVTDLTGASVSFEVHPF